MTLPTVSVNTVPYCGACGFELTDAHSLVPIAICDACGANLLAYGFAGLVPPSDLQPTPDSGQVTFAWNDNADADSTESSESVDGALAVWSDWATDTSPTIVSATAGTLVGLRVRSILDGGAGPYVEESGTTAA